MIGQTLGRFHIAEKIGAGGMGVVYRARDERLDRDVALKVLPPGTLTNEVARQRFRKEALALSKLNHPNIATLHDFDTQEGVDFLVMEYIPGSSLEEKLAAGSMSEKEITGLGAQLAAGLAAAHAQGVVHRDLKPGNLRVTPDGRLKILDFGLAKLLRPAGDLAATESAVEAPVVAGTLPYMAPEQLRGEQVDARSDIYSAGAVLYEMATGRRPFPEAQAPRLIQAILHELPAPPCALNQRLSSTLENLILKTLDKDPERRYQSATELRVDLERQRVPSSPAAVSQPETRLFGLAHPKYSLLASLFVTFFGLTLYTLTYLAQWHWGVFGIIDNIERRTYDSRLLFRGRVAPDPNIVIVAIDNGTLGEFGWSLSHSHYGSLLDKLTADGAAVIGFDTFFPSPDVKSAQTFELLERTRKEYLQATPPSRRDPAYLARLEAMRREADADAKFAQALARAGNVVLGQLFLHQSPQANIEKRLDSPEKKGMRPMPQIFRGEEVRSEVPNLPLFVEASGYNLGHLNMSADPDGRFRHADLVLRYKNDFYPSLSVQMLRRYLRVPDREFGVFHDEAGIQYLQLGKLQVPTDPAGRILISYQGPESTYPHYSMGDVIKGASKSRAFRDKIVLVGATAIGIADLRSTPFEKANYPGVELHANVLDTILNGRYIRRGTREKVIDLGLVVLFGLVFAQVLVRLRPSWAALVTLAVSAAFLTATYLALARFQMWLSVVIPAAVLLANFVAVTLVPLFVGRTRRATPA